MIPSHPHVHVHHGGIIRSPPVGMPVKCGVNLAYCRLVFSMRFASSSDYVWPPGGFGFDAARDIPSERGTRCSLELQRVDVWKKVLRRVNTLTVNTLRVNPI